MKFTKAIIYFSLLITIVQVTYYGSHLLYNVASPWSLLIHSGSRGNTVTKIREIRDEVRKVPNTYVLAGNVPNSYVLPSITSNEQPVTAIELLKPNTISKEMSLTGPVNELLKLNARVSIDDGIARINMSTGQPGSNIATAIRPTADVAKLSITSQTKQSLTLVNAYIARPYQLKANITISTSYRMDAYLNSARADGTARLNKCWSNYTFTPTIFLHDKWPKTHLVTGYGSSQYTVQLVTMGAYYDTREYDGTNPGIRLFCVSNPALIMTAPNCLALYDMNDTGPLVVEHLEVTVRMLDKRTFHVNNTRYFQVSVYCFSNTGLLKGGKLPKYVSLTSDPCHVPVQIPIVYPDEEQGSLWAICVPPLYGKLDPRETLMMIEWIEANLMLGVNEINLYNVTLKANIALEQVLDYYTSKGVVHVHWFPPPVEQWNPDEIYDASKLQMRATLNDCLMRNYNRYRVVSPLDIDEILVPGTQWDYLKYMTVLSNNPLYAGFLFRTGNIYLDFPSVGVRDVPVANRSDFVVASRYTAYAQGPAGRYKPIVHTGRCAIIWNHNCFSTVRSTKTSVGMKTVSSETDGIVYHFRRRCRAVLGAVDENINTLTMRQKAIAQNVTCDQRQREFFKNPRASKMVPMLGELKRRVEHVVQTLGLTNAPRY